MKKGNGTRGSTWPQVFSVVLLKLPFLYAVAVAVADPGSEEKGHPGILIYGDMLNYKSVSCVSK